MKIYNTVGLKLQTLVTKVRMKASEWKKVELGARTAEKIPDSIVVRVIHSSSRRKEKKRAEYKNREVVEMVVSVGSN